MRVGSLFSGYGGLDMAVGGELAWYSEIEPAACKVMEAHHPGVPNLGDVTQVDWSMVEPVDVLTGGYPCQPFSMAGQRKGEDDERHLWPHVRDAISALAPRVTVLENVRGHLSLGFASVLADLADLGLSARWGVVRASDAGAPHQRARLFIVADAEGWRRGTRTGHPKVAGGSGHSGTGDGGGVHAGCGVDVADSDGAGSEGWQHTGSDGARFRFEPLGSTAPVTNSDGITLRHGIHGGRASSAQFEPVGCGDIERDAESWSSDYVPQNEIETTFGPYANAVERWRRVLNRPVPRPTVQRNDRDRLNPVFVEWMMGLPEGWVTGQGLSASQELKLLGNGVVPQQARLALELL